MNPKFAFENPEQFLGKHVIIDLTVYDYDETAIEQTELHGSVIRVSEGEGVVVKLSPSGKEYRLPPDWNAFEPTPSGPIMLERSGELIDHADLRTKLVVHMPPPEYEGPDRSRG